MGRGHDANTLVRNVVLHASLGINGELDLLVNGPTETAVVLTGILVISVVLGVVNVLLGPVATKSFAGNFELAGAIAEGHEAEDAKEEADSFSRDGLDRSNIDGLGVVAGPVAKVGLLYHELGELLAAVVGVGGGKAEEDVFDITMAP